MTLMMGKKFRSKRCKAIIHMTIAKNLSSFAMSINHLFWSVATTITTLSAMTWFTTGGIATWPVARNKIIITKSIESQPNGTYLLEIFLKSMRCNFFSGGSFAKNGCSSASSRLIRDVGSYCNIFSIRLNSCRWSSLSSIRYLFKGWQFSLT